MAYCSAEDLNLVGLPEQATFGIAPEKIEAVLEAASAKIDSYLRGRGYTVPLTDWGEDVRQCCATIAAWDILRSLRGVNPSDPAHMAIAKAQDDAINWLRDVAKGVANFGLGETGSKRRATGVAQFISVVNGCGERGW